MNEFNLEKYRSAWNGGAIELNESLTADEIRSLLNKESLTISQLFHRGLALDLVIKSIFLPALAMLLVLFSDGTTIQWVNTCVLAIVAFLAFFQWKTLQAIPGPGVLSNTLRDYLADITHFYRHRYIWAVCVNALTAPLVFYTGSQYYTYLKYGGLRPLDTTDLAVFGLFLLLAFGIGLAAHMWQFRFHIRELESCLHDMDALTVALKQAGKRAFQRQQSRLVAITLAFLGLLVLAYFVFI
ncbi:MAG: hypothetical protein OQJ84_05010 [Xanthomonadales bacterium]|nr:hypothetical protein [Xanthomonadales bacterium]